MPGSVGAGGCDAPGDPAGPIACATLALAAWARYLATAPAAQRAPDSRGDRAATLAQRGLREPLAFLELDEVFTPRLRGSERFREGFAAAATDLETRGPRGAIETVVAS